ncbi:MAG: vitamin K epoxide reductase family protein [Vicinamibacterales bacterium]
MSRATASSISVPPARSGWLVALAVLGLAASSASAFVHYQILNDPTYASFCDVNATFSCTEAYSSRYGSVGGIPVAVFGVIFFAFILGLVVLCSSSRAAAGNLAGYVFAASTIGLAVVLYLAYASFVILKAVCVLCAGTYIAVIGLFLLSGSATRYPMTSLPARALADLRLLFRSPSALAAAVAFVIAAGAAVAWFPGEPVVAVSAEAADEGEQAPAAPALSPAQIAQFEAYLAQQPRVPLQVPSEGAAVVVVKFNDYQCPPCRQTFMEYKPVFAKWAKEQPGKVRYVTRDFPLERQCNATVTQDLHPAACEAAVAVRLAREKGKADAMEDWLFANQPALSPASVRSAVVTVAGITDFDARFAATLELVKADIAQGSALNVSGTPTFFMNGMRLPGLRAEAFDAAIAWELRRVTSGK